MKPESHQAVFFRQSQQTLLHIPQPSSLQKKLNFQGIEDTSQQFCAHCPYLREEPRETSSYHPGPSVQLQQANINTILSKTAGLS